MYQGAGIGANLYEGWIEHADFCLDVADVSGSMLDFGWIDDVGGSGANAPKS